MPRKSLQTRLKTVLLEAAYKGEVLCSRFQGIASNDPRYNGEYALVRKLGKRIRFAIDAGCNMGDWTAEVLRCANPTCVVGCVEADPENAARIASRFAGDDRVHLWNAAISDVAGKARFKTGYGENSGVGHLMTVNDDVGDTIEVDAITLDELARQKFKDDIDLIKVDIEGAEMTLLRGATRLFTEKRIGVMQLEYNVTWQQFGARMSDLFEFAARYDYHLMAATPLGATLLPSYGIGLEDYRLRNLILARSDCLEAIEPLGPVGRARVEAARSDCEQVS